MGDDRPAVQADLPRGCGPQHVVGGGVSSVVVAFAVLWTVVPYGMFPHDEGQYGQSAVRILAGELPHRDFHEIYSGGLSYWHALLFWLFGEQLIVLRRALVVLAMPAVLAAYAIALRFTASSALAAIVAVAGIIVSVGTLHTVWANLYLGFLSMIIAWLLIRYADDEHPRWVVLIGVLCGIAIAIKITGLYTLAAAGLAITFRGTAPPASPAIAAGRWASPEWLERLYRGAVAATAIAAGPALVAAHPNANTLAYFAVPTVAMGVGLLGAGRRFEPRKMALRHAWLCGGVIAIVLLCMTPWIVADATAALYEGLFVRPRVRLEAAYWPPPAISRLVFAVPLVVVSQSLGAVRGWHRVQTGTAICTAAWLGFGILSGNVGIVLALLDGWRWLPAVGMPLAVARWCRTSGDGKNRHDLYALYAITAFSALHQYPYAIPFYFLFHAPLLMLAMVASSVGVTGDVGNQVTTLRTRVAPVILCITLFAVCMGARFGRTGFFVDTWESWADSTSVTISGLKVSASMARPYFDLKALLDENLSPSQTILAGPDCSDVYFFTGRHNLTPVMYGVIAGDRPCESGLVELARAPIVGAVVINTRPSFSRPWSKDVVGPLIQKMRKRTKVGRFVLYYDSQQPLSPVQP